MKRLVIIDGFAILHRAFHALPPLTTSKGEQINAIYGFITMVLKVVADLSPTHLVVALDLPKPTFRRQMYVSYQAQRPKMDEGLSCQIEKMKKILTVLNIPSFAVEGFEADDVIGTITKKYLEKTEKSDTAVVVTGDRDILQLVDDRIRTYMPVKGLSQAKLYDETEVEAKFGIKPHQIADYKALVGDQSDNYPGVAGIGPKTAADLLSRFGTLTGIYERLGELQNENIRQKLIENQENALLSQKLATIVRDVPLDFNPDNCLLKNFDTPYAHQVFEEMEFKSLIPRLVQKAPKKPEARVKVKKKEKTADDNQLKLI